MPRFRQNALLSRESTYRLVIVDFEVEEVRYALINPNSYSDVFLALG